MLFTTNGIAIAYLDNTEEAERKDSEQNSQQVKTTKYGLSNDTTIEYTSFILLYLFSI